MYGEVSNSCLLEPSARFTHVLRDIDHFCMPDKYGSTHVTQILKALAVKFILAPSPGSKELTVRLNPPQIKAPLQVVFPPEVPCSNSKCHHSGQELEATHVVRLKAAMQAAQLPQQGRCQVFGGERGQDSQGPPDYRATPC